MRKINLHKFSEHKLLSIHQLTKAAINGQLKANTAIIKQLNKKIPEEQELNHSKNKN